MKTSGSWGVSLRVSNRFNLYRFANPIDTEFMQ